MDGRTNYEGGNMTETLVKVRQRNFHNYSKLGLDRQDFLDEIGFLGQMTSTTN
jgi:hypothetical protein